MSPFTRSLALLAVIVPAVLLAFPGVYQDVRYYDEAVQLVTARAIVRGHGYVNESLPGSPPHPKYPPLVPMSLAAVWWLFPDFPANVVVMRLLMLACGVLFLWLTFRYFTEVLGVVAIEALALVAIVGWHPRFVGYATVLSGEVVYALFSVASLHFHSRFVVSSRAVHLALALGCAGLAVLSRTAGIALLAGVVTHLALRRRFRPALAGVVSAAAILVPWQAWGWVAQRSYGGYPAEIASNYVGYFRHFALVAPLGKLLRMIEINALEAAGSWAYFLIPSVNTVLPWKSWTAVALATVVPVALHRLWRVVGNGPAAMDLYCAFYLLLVLLWPWPFTDRFVLVLTPFLVYYGFEAIGSLVALSRHRWSAGAVTIGRRLVLAALAASMLVNTLGYLSLQRATTEDAEAITAEFRALLAWVEQNTPRDSILVGGSDPVYYLLTGRKAIRLSYPDPFSLYYADGASREFPQAGRLLEWFRTVGACYVVQDPMVTQPLQIRYYFSLIRALGGVSENALETVYRGRIDWFAVYRMTRCPR